MENTLLLGMLKANPDLSLSYDSRTGSWFLLGHTLQGITLTKGLVNSGYFMDFSGVYKLNKSAKEYLATFCLDD